MQQCLELAGAHDFDINTLFFQHPRIAFDGRNDTNRTHFRHLIDMQLGIDRGQPIARRHGDPIGIRHGIRGDIQRAAQDFRQAIDPGRIATGTVPDMHNLFDVAVLIHLRQTQRITGNAWVRDDPEE